MSTPFVKTLCASMLVAVTAFSSGCSTTGGDSALMGDLLTERAITRAINSESSFDGSTILVSCVDGVVTLAGNADNALDKALAEEIVRGIDGVVEVNNLINTQA